MLMLIQMLVCAAKTTDHVQQAKTRTRHDIRCMSAAVEAWTVSSTPLAYLPCTRLRSIFSLPSGSHHRISLLTLTHHGTTPTTPTITANVAFEDLVVAAPSPEEEQTSPRRKKKKKRQGETFELLDRWRQQQQEQQGQGQQQQHPQHEQEEEEEGGAGFALLCDPRQGGEAGRWSNDDNHDDYACSIPIYNYGAAGTTTNTTTTTVCPRPIRPIMLSNANDAHTPLLVVLPPPSSSSPATPSSSSSYTLAIRPPPLRPLRGLVFATNVLNNISLGCTAPFLQHHLEVHFQQSYQSSGLVFAVFPLVALLCSPLGAVLCRAGRDKFLVWQLGLLTSVLASLGFGLADSVPLFLLMRGLQGLGFALSTIAGLGLLIECSPDLTADIARQEVLVGLSMVIAPAAGGLLYTYAGFAAIFNILAAGFMILVLGLTAGRKLGYLGGREREEEEERGAWWRLSSWPGSVSTWFCCATGGGGAAAAEGKRSSGEEEAATALLIPQEDTEVVKTEGPISPASPASPPPLTLLGMLLLPGVLAAALLVMVTFHSISFLELAFAGHAEAALGLAPLGTGLLFSCVDIAYATCAYLMAWARKGGKGGREGGREGEKEEEEDRLSPERRGNGGQEEVGRRTLSRSSSTSSTSSSSSSSSSSRFGFSFLNLRALAVTGLGCQALAMCFLGPLPLFSLPLPSFLSPSLLAWVSVAIGCLMVGVGEAFALVPAVDLMRAALPPSLSLAMSDGSNSGGEAATGHLAAVMSAATSLGECVGPLLGGLLMEVLPQRREVGCKGGGEGGGEEDGCVSGFRWTTAWIATALAIAGCVCYVGLAKERVGEEDGVEGEEVVAPTPVAAAVATAAIAAAVVEEGAAGMGGGRVHVYKPPTVVIPSPPLPPRRLSRPPTPISLASLRVPSSTSMAKPMSSSSAAASSVGGSRRRSTGGGGGGGEKGRGGKEKAGEGGTG